MKLSEARILIFLSISADRYKYARYISDKLKMDYGYLIRILKSLKMYKIIDCVKGVDNKKFYRIINHDFVEQAKVRMGMK